MPVGLVGLNALRRQRRSVVASQFSLQQADLKTNCSILYLAQSENTAVYGMVLQVSNSLWGIV